MCGSRRYMGLQDRPDFGHPPITHTYRHDKRKQHERMAVCPIIGKKTDYLQYLRLDLISTEERRYRVVLQLAICCRSVGAGNSFERCKTDLSRSQLACPLCGTSFV